MIIEKLIDLITPHLCLQCRNEGFVLCSSCIKILPSPPQKQVPGLNGNIWSVTAYDGVAKQLIAALKFNFARQAAQDAGRAIAACIPPDQLAECVTFVPTATSRVRARGYDQAKLIAQAVAVELGLPCLPLLGRVTQKRQVGADRQARLAQMCHAFRPRLNHRYSHILLIDDVLTTGATVLAASKVLQAAGAERVDVAVFATTAPK